MVADTVAGMEVGDMEVDKVADIVAPVSQLSLSPLSPLCHLCLLCFMRPLCFLRPLCPLAHPPASGACFLLLQIFISDPCGIHHQSVGWNATGKQMQIIP